MSASRTALRSRAAAYVAFSPSCVAAGAWATSSSMVLVVWMVLVMVLSWVVVPTGESRPPSDLQGPHMREAARGRLRWWGWFDGPPQLGSHHARVGATVELMSVRVRDEDALGDESHPPARAARGIVGDVGR